MSYTNCFANYVSSVKYAANTAWALTTAKSVGDIVKQTAPTTNNERLWLCIVAGTTSGTEPTWTTTRGDKITDGTVTWIEITGQAAVNGDLGSTPNWTNGAKSTNVSQGHIIKDVAGTHIFICTTSGNAGSGAEPSWSTGALGNTTVDNGVTWTYIGTGFTAWKAPHARIDKSLRASWTDNALTVIRKIYVGHDHAETQTGAISWPAPTGDSILAPTDMICVSTAGSVPPVAADLATTATVTVTGGSAIQISTGHYRWVYGIGFTTGNSGGQTVQFNGDTADRFYENCNFNIPAGASNGQFQFQSINGANIFKNCTFTFGAAGQGMLPSSHCQFDNCTFNGTSPTAFIISPTNGTRAIFRNCDLSAFTSTALRTGGNSGGALCIFRDCKMPTSYTLGSFAGITNVNDVIVLSRCDGSGNEWQYTQHDASSTLTADATVARTGGAKDGGTPISWKGVTTTSTYANSADMAPPVIAEWNGVTGSTVTATIYGVINASAVPMNDACFVDVDYMGTSGNTFGSRKSSRVADFITAPANLTADSTSDWTAGSVAARQNSHTYTVGDVIKVASNSGRIFFCTASSGNTASSEPGGYASAVDGGSVTDGSATFRAGCRFSMAISLSSPAPQIAGNVYAQIRFSQKSVTVYFDPLMTLT